MSKYYTVPSLDDERVFTSYDDAEQFVCDHEYFQSEMDKEEALKDLIEETDYFEDLDKAQQNYLLDI
tara:strand:+ start:784 stop:984 length:201 start_codon:yes stop_codon:yes gene_type:complete